MFTAERFEPGRHRNHSDFPQGDDDVYRNAARSNMTTNRHYHGNVSDIITQILYNYLQLNIHSYQKLNLSFPQF